MLHMLRHLYPWMLRLFPYRPGRRAQSGVGNRTNRNSNDVRLFAEFDINRRSANGAEKRLDGITFG